MPAHFQSDGPVTAAAMSDKQFARLEELLMPGYLLSKHYLDQMLKEKAPAVEIPDTPLISDEGFPTSSLE